jgi:DNA repair protein RadC
MSKIQEMLPSERPREKAFCSGVRSLTDREILAVLLRTGIKGNDVMESAQNLLEKAGNLSGLMKMSIREISSVKGVSRIKALELLTAFELCRRVRYENAEIRGAAGDSLAVVSWLQSEIGSSLQEQFLAVFLDKSLHIVSYKTLFQGTIDSSEVHPREIFKNAYLENSTAVILVHNHPSGVPEPSDSDILTTIRLIKAAQIMDVTILDHLIVSASSYFSFSDSGLMKQCMDNADKR